MRNNSSLLADYDRCPGRAGTRSQISLVIVGLCAALFATLSADASTLVVTSAADSGPGTLRQRISEAMPGDEIVFAAGITTIDLTSGQLVLDETLNIVGPGAGALRVQRSSAPGTPSFRIFEISLASVHAAISGLTIENGYAIGDGGGIDNQGGQVTLRDVVVSGNSGVSGTYGAGINNELGTMDLTNVVVSSNSASGEGGGIRTYYGELVLAGSTISGNSAVSGGGISNQGTRLTISRSTISNNSSTYIGGGIANSFSEATLTNVTISGNASIGPSAYGGGIGNSGVPLHIVNCTIVHNAATNHGGGISNPTGGSATARNSIIALNTSLSGPDVRGDLISNGFNLIGSVNGASITLSQPSDQLGVSSAQINLGPLQANGGSTQTHALRAGSFAIDKGNSSASTTDQRGLHRPIDQTGIPNVAGGDGADIGAYESVPEPEGFSVGLLVLAMLGSMQRSRGHRDRFGYEPGAGMSGS